MVIYLHTQHIHIITEKERALFYALSGSYGKESKGDTIKKELER